MKLKLLATLLTATLALNSTARADAQIPSQLLGEWKALSDIIVFRSDGSFLRSTQRSDLFASCGPVLTVASVGTFALNGNQIAVSPQDGFLYTQNTCTGTSSKSHYVNASNTYFVQLGDNGQTLVLTGPIGSKYSIRNVYSKTSR